MVIGFSHIFVRPCFSGWGPTWAAEGGYIRVQMTKTNDAGLCGLYTYGARPTL